MGARRKRDQTRLSSLRSAPLIRRSRPAARGCRGATQRLDRLGVLARADLHASRLGDLGDRDRERQHTMLAVGPHVLRIECVAEEHLARVGPLRPLGDDHLVALSRLKAPLGPHGQNVLLDGQLDRAGLDAREVELDDEPVAAPVGVHREPPRRARRSGRELLSEPVELAIGVIAHKHGGRLSGVAAGGPLPAA
jgi:hypothetical protein